MFAQVPEDWAYVIGSDGIFDVLSDQATDASEFGWAPGDLLFTILLTPF